MKDKTPFQKFIDMKKEKGISVDRLAKLWGVKKQTVYNAYNSGYVKSVELLKAIYEKSGADPRLLMGLPVESACPRCHRDINVSELVYYDEVEEKPNNTDSDFIGDYTSEAEYGN